MKKTNVKMLVEAGIMIALSILLSQIKLFKAPQGGSVTAGSMIPIILFSLRWGVKEGVVAGILFGILKFILSGSAILMPLQVILEYPVAFGMLGLSGIFSKSFNENGNNNYFKISISIFIAILGRFLCHFLAGIVFWGEYAEGQNVILYSLVYQSSYLIPEFIISLLMVSLIWEPLKKAGI